MTPSADGMLPDAMPSVLKTVGCGLPLVTAKQEAVAFQSRSTEVVTAAERTLGSRATPCLCAEGVGQGEWQSTTPHIGSTRNRTYDSA